METADSIWEIPGKGLSPIALLLLSGCFVVPFKTLKVLVNCGQHKKAHQVPYG